MGKLTIWPCTLQFNVDTDPKYQAWLRNDHPREFAYRSLINYLIDFGRGAKIERILDAGTGTGVWAIALASVLPYAEVDAIDIQEENIGVAKENAKVFPTLESRLNFMTADVNKFRPNKSYDIIVTELEGGIGGNEGAKRAFNSLRRLLSPKGMIIPQLCETYILPVDLGEINQLLPNTGANLILKGMTISDPFSCYYYVYGVGNSAFLSGPLLLDSIDSQKPIQEGYTKKLEFTVKRNGKITGFLAYFENRLLLSGGPSLRLTNHPDCPITSWGQVYFPVHELNVRADDTITLKFSECITSKGPLPHYEWEVSKNGAVFGSYSNEENQIRRK